MDRQEQLWAPWRLAFISGEAAAAEKSQAQAKAEPALELLPGAEADCFLCRAAVGEKTPGA